MTAVDPAQLPGTLVIGPSALAGDPRRFFHLTWTLAVQEFKLRFFGSVLGYFWQLMRPLLLFAVLYVVLVQAIKIGSGAKYFPAVLLTNIVLFQFFAEATAGSVGSVVDRENLVRKIQFPRLVVPAAVALTAAFNLLVNLVAVALFMVLAGVQPHLGWLEMPLILALLATFAAGLAMLLSALFVRLRDLKPIWEVALQLLFYGTPIIYTIETVKVAWLQKVMMANPLGALVQQTRHALIDPSAPDAAAVMGSRWLLLVPLAIVLGAFALGLWVFQREAPRIAEDL
jgi:ABC-2 type transport system permease protein